MSISRRIACVLLLGTFLLACGGSTEVPVLEASVLDASARDAPDADSPGDVVLEAAACSKEKTPCGAGCCAGLTCIDKYCAPPNEPGMPTPVGDE